MEEREESILPPEEVERILAEDDYTYYRTKYDVEGLSAKEIEEWKKSPITRTLFEKAVRDFNIAYREEGTAMYLGIQTDDFDCYNKDGRIRLHIMMTIPKLRLKNNEREDSGI